MEEASYLMDRPIGGWSEVVTNHTMDLKFAVLDERFKGIDERFNALDHKLDALEHRLLAQIERRFRIQTFQLMTFLLAGLSLFGVLQRG